LVTTLKRSVQALSKRRRGPGQGHTYRSANAAVAGLLPTTDCIVTEKPKDKDKGPQAPDDDMGDMDM
jgi:hypothetical protein